MSRDTRHEITTAASRLFSEKGFEGTSLDAIITISNTSKGTLYHYFRSKDHLYTTVLEGLFDDLWAEAFGPTVLANVTRGTYWDILTRALQRQAELLRARPGDLRLLSDFLRKCRSNKPSGPIAKLRLRYLSLAEDVARLGQSLGCLRGDLSPRRCAEIAEALFVVCLDWFKAPGDEESVLAGIETIRRAVATTDADIDGGVVVHLPTNRARLVGDENPRTRAAPRQKGESPLPLPSSPEAMEPPKEQDQ